MLEWVMGEARVRVPDELIVSLRKDAEATVGIACNAFLATSRLVDGVAQTSHTQLLGGVGDMVLKGSVGSRGGRGEEAQRRVP
eukprot:27148-Eustigmatos_ZCMA.PRE.1